MKPAAPESSAPAFYAPALCIIGVGLIGGSLALALKRAGGVGRVLGVDRARDQLQRACDLGVIDEIAADPAAAVAAADVTVLATPVNATAALLPSLAPALDASKILTDTGSVKSGVCAAARAALGKHIARFVPGHPVAGKEHSGVASAAADLFHKHTAVLTPSPATDARALATIRQMWRAAGAEVCEMDAELHDQVLAVTSHLPHILAYAMMDVFAEAEQDLAHSRAMVAGGFYDFTRTVSSDAEMWRDICAMNRDQILARIDQFTARLTRLRGMIATAEHTALAGVFADAKALRATLAKQRATRNETG